MNPCINESDTQLYCQPKTLKNSNWQLLHSDKVYASYTNSTGTTRINYNVTILNVKT